MADGLITGLGGKPNRYYHNGVLLDRLYLGGTLVWPDPPPALASLFPDTGSITGGTVVTITGTGFTPDSVVKINGAVVASAYSSPTSMTFTTPSLPEGVASVTVTSPFGPSNALPFTYSLITLTAQGMQTSASQSIPNGSFGGSGADNKLGNMVAQSGTSPSAVVDNALVVNGTGNIALTASATYSTLTSGLRLDIWLNGVRVSSTSSPTSASVSGFVTQGDLLELHVLKTNTSGRTCSSASLSYTVN